MYSCIKEHINDNSSIKSNTGVRLHNHKGAQSIYIGGPQHKMNNYMVQAVVASSKVQHYVSYSLSPCSVCVALIHLTRFHTFRDS